MKHFISFFNSIHKVLCIGLILVSCKEHEVAMSPEQLQALTETATEGNHQILTTTQEVLDITSNILYEEGISIEGENRISDNCTPTLLRQYVTDNTHYDTTIYAGTITIDYRNGSSCPSGSSTKKGKISDTFTYIVSRLNQTTFALEQTIVFKNFHRDTIQLEGTFYTNAKTGELDTLSTLGSKVIYASGAYVNWNGTLTSAKNEMNGTIEVKTVTGFLSGVISNGTYFRANIENNLIYVYSCGNDYAAFPVRGTIRLFVQGTEALIDYGDGSCDLHYEITAGGKTISYNY